MENQINVGDQDTQQIGHNPVNQPVVSTEKPKTNYLLIVGIVLACFVVFGAGGYFLGMKQWLTNNSASEANLPKPTSIPQASNTSNQDETANWKTYTNDKYNYSIKYPSNWSVTRDESNQPAFRSLIQLNSSGLTTLPNFVIQVSTKSYSQLLTSSMKSFQMTKLISTMRSDTLTGAGNSDYFVNVVFQNSGNVFDIQANFTNPPNQNELQQFNQILSTFEIIVSTNTNTENQIGYIKSVYDKNNVKYLTIDYIQWLTQTDGTCRSGSEVNSNVLACNPNGYLIVNDNPQLRTFEISGNVVIDFSDFKNAGLGWKNDQQLSSSNLTLSEFQDIFLGNDSSIAWLKDAVYRVEINGNKITKIRYQYQP